MDYGLAPPCKQLINCGYCAKSMRRKNLKDHTARCHKGLEPKLAEGDVLKQLMDEIKRRKDEEKDRKDNERLKQANAKRQEKQREKQLEMEQAIIRQRELQSERKEQEEARKKKKKEAARTEKLLMQKSKAPKQTSNTRETTITPSEFSHAAQKTLKDRKDQPEERNADHFGVKSMNGGASFRTEGRSVSTTACSMATNIQKRTDSVTTDPFQSKDSQNVSASFSFEVGKNPVMPECNNGQTRDHYECEQAPVAQAQTTNVVSEEEMRKKFKDTRRIEDLIKHSPNFVYDQDMRSVHCTTCAHSACSKPIHFNPSIDDSKSLQLAKFRDVKKKMLDHLYKTSVHQRNLQDFSESEKDANVEAGTRVIRAIYGKLKNGGGYKSIENTVAERAADDVDYGTINHGRHFASSMTTPIYQALKQKIHKSIKRNLPGTGQSPPFCIIADKMTPARKTLQIVGIIHPNQDTGEMQSTCLGVQEAKDGTGLGTCEEMVDCLKEHYTADEIRKSLAGIAVDGAYHHHNIKEHISSVLDLSTEANEVLATNWDAAHLIELAAQKSRGQTGKDKSISVPWIKDTFDTVTSVKTFAGRGKNWNELQDFAALESVRRSDNDSGALNLASTKPLKKFQSFSGTRFARFSQRVLGNMRQNYMATCNYLESKGKDGSGLWKKLTRPDFAMRLCGLDDIYNEIGRASERLQSCRLYGWNTIEILEGTMNSLKKMSENLQKGEIDPKMVQFNSALEEISSLATYQGVAMQSSSSSGQSENVISNVRRDLAKHLTDFTEDLERRSREYTPKICHLSRESFAFQRVMSLPDDTIPPAFDELTKLYSKAGYVSHDLKKEDWIREYTAFVDAVHADKIKLDIEGFTKRQQLLKMSEEEAIYSKYFTDEKKTEGFRNVTYLLCRSAVQSSCEAVTEGMGSVVKNTLQGRENMSVEKLSQEVFIRLNGPKSNHSCDSVLRLAGDIRFGGRKNWHFVTGPQAKYGVASKVVSRINSEEAKFNFGSDTDE